MSLARAALQMEIDEAKQKIADGIGPRDPFERVVFEEAREQMGRPRRYMVVDAPEGDPQFTRMIPVGYAQT